MESDASEAASAKGSKAPRVLQVAELALDCRPLPIHRLPPLGLVGDQRMQAVGLDPGGGWAALARGAAPLGSAALAIRPGELLLPVITERRQMLTRLHGFGFPQRDHR
jgi:hypothetical protein